MKLLSFDIEISDVLELRKYEDMDEYAPFQGEYTVNGYRKSYYE